MGTIAEMKEQRSQKRRPLTESVGWEFNNGENQTRPLLHTPPLIQLKSISAASLCDNMVEFQVD